MQIALGAAAVAYSSFWLAGYIDRRKKEEEQGMQEGAEGTFFRRDTVKSSLRQIRYPHYTILYSNFHKSPMAVHEYLTKDVADGGAPRAKYFYPDDHIKQKHFQVNNSYFYQTKAYARYNINRGHMAAAGNYSGSEAEKFLTFTFANIIPQDGTNNGGIWNTFQRYSRNLLFGGLCDSVEVISGPIYPEHTPFDGKTKTAEDAQETYKTHLKVLKQNGIPIPAKLYKIIKCNSKEGVYFSAYQNLNRKTADNDAALNNFEVRIEDVERQTGLKFNIKGRPLREIDGGSLSKSKRQHDYPFYYGLLANALTVREMSDGLRRAYSQDIEPKLEEFTEQIRKFTLKQSVQIQEEQVASCQKLRKILSLGRKLSYLKHGDQQKQQRERKAKEYYVQCHKNEEEEQTVLKDYKPELAKFSQKNIETPLKTEATAQ